MMRLAGISLKSNSFRAGTHTGPSKNWKLPATFSAVVEYLLVFVGTVNQRVGRQTRVKRLARTLNTHDRQDPGVEQAQLNQHGSLVPVNVLVGQFALAESNDGDERNLHPLSRRRN